MSLQNGPASNANHHAHLVKIHGNSAILFYDDSGLESGFDIGIPAVDLDSDYADFWLWQCERDGNDSEVEELAIGFETVRQGTFEV